MTNEEKQSINNLKKYIEEDFAYREPLKNISDFDKFCYNHCKDIDTVLKLTEKKQKEIDNLEIKLDDKETELQILKDDIKADEKEKEELQNKIMEKDLEIIGAEEYTKASMGEIIEHYYTANEECIPKKKIQDKIDEINNEKLNYSENEYYLEMEIKGYAIEALKELIESEE